MIRRKHSRALVSTAAAEEDVNPNAYIINIADCMLVLMLGFLVALITRYGVDLSQTTQAARDVQDIIGIEVVMDVDKDGQVDDQYEQRGTVYYDEKSGKYYFVSD